MRDGIKHKQQVKHDEASELQYSLHTPQQEVQKSVEKPPERAAS
jgi:hypothetical protein